MTWNDAELEFLNTLKDGYVSNINISALPDMFTLNTALMIIVVLSQVQFYKHIIHESVSAASAPDLQKTRAAAAAEKDWPVYESEARFCLSDPGRKPDHHPGL